MKNIRTLLNHLLFVSLTIFIITCGKPNTKNELGTKTITVKYYGALKNAMFNNDLSAKIALSDLPTTSHLYALGAFENLKGEVQIFDSKPFNTSVEDSALVIDQSFGKKATLLVYASVEKWQNIILPDSIVTYAQFEIFVEFIANEYNLNTKEPFPFMLKGVIQSFDWHVINWQDGDTEHSHEKHRTSGLYGTLENQDVEILGFYSNAHHGIFTHHTTNMHMHVKTTDNKLAGHVDGLTLGRQMILLLPKVE